MHAVQIFEYGGRDGLHHVETDRPVPAAGQALVQLDYAGVNFIDVYMREGRYKDSATYGTPLPFTLGMEGAGTVLETGTNAEQLQPGDRVAYCLERGSYAEYAAVPAWKLVKVPQSITLDVATVLMLQGCTAHYLSHSLFPIQAGQWCLIHAGAGGVGQLLIQLAKQRGAKVITPVGNEEKAARVKALGADHAVLYRTVDFADEVDRLTAGEGVHVVYDSVGKDTIEGSLRSLRIRGTCVNFGGSSGMVQQISPLRLAEAGSVFFTRPHLAHYLRNAEEIAMRTSQLFDLVASEKLKVNIDTVFPLADAKTAHEVLEGRGTTGKLLLKTN